MAELFWRISDEARAKLIQYQADHYKDKTAEEMARWKAPWELPPPRPEIPVHITEEELEEIDLIMRQPPSRSRGQGG